MNCNYCKLQLDAYLDSQLSEEENKQIERHLHQCVSCYEIYSQKQKIREKLAELQIYAPDYVSFAIKKIKRQRLIYQKKKKQRLLGGCTVTACMLIVAMGILTRRGNDISQMAQVANAMEKEIVEERGYFSEDLKSEDIFSGTEQRRDLTQTIQLEMQEDDLQWLVAQLQVFLGEKSNLYIEKIKSGYLFYDPILYEKELRELMEQKNYIFSSDLTDILLIEIKHNKNEN